MREGTRWVHLRECLDCGHVGCRDTSPRRHVSAHAQRLPLADAQKALELASGGGLRGKVVLVP